MEDLVLLERRPNGVAVVTLNNPKVNALSQAMLARIKEIALDLTANPPGAVVITGGERIFAAGADISEFGGTAEGDRIGLGFHSALDAVAAIPRRNTGQRWQDRVHPMPPGAVGATRSAPLHIPCSTHQ